MVTQILEVSYQNDLWKVIKNSLTIRHPQQIPGSVRLDQIENSN
jgi:hypothetical protein